MTQRIARWTCALTQPARYLSQHTVYESSTLAVAGGCGLRLRLYPNINGKMYAEVCAASGLTLTFSFTATWRTLKRQSSDEEVQQCFLCEVCEHVFQGGWLRLPEPLAMSAAVSGPEIQLEIAIEAFSWKSRESELESECQGLKEKLIQTAKKSEADLSALLSLKSQHLADMSAREALEQQFAEAKRKYLAEFDARQEVEQHVAEARSEIERMKAQVSQLQGEMPALQRLDKSGVEHLLEHLHQAHERVQQHLNVLRQEERVCKICFESEADAVLTPCGHLVLCELCAGQVTECPICRQNVAGVMKVYR